MEKKNSNTGWTIATKWRKKFKIPVRWPYTD